MTRGMLAELGWSERSLKLQIPILISSHFAEYGFFRNGFSVDNFLLLPEVNFLNHIFSSIFFVNLNVGLLLQTLFVFWIFERSICTPASYYEVKYIFEALWSKIYL